MTSVSRPLLLLVLPALAVMAGCGSEDVASGGSGSSDVVESESPVAAASQECRELLDDSVLEALGWPAGDPAGESAGRCERMGQGDVLLVGERPDLDSSHDSDRALKAYDRACASMESDSGGVVDSETEWLGSTRACLKEFAPGRDVGTARMFVLTDQATIVEIRVSAATPTKLPELRGGLTTLVEGVEATW